MRFNPFNRHRPTRVPDGIGGWYFSPAPVLVFGAVEIKDYGTMFICRSEEDVAQEDVLEIQGRYWKVELQSPAFVGGPMTAWQIALCDRPQVAPTTTGAATTTGAP